MLLPGAFERPVHRITLSADLLDAEAANRVLSHELRHAWQWEQ